MRCRYWVVGFDICFGGSRFLRVFLCYLRRYSVWFFYWVVSIEMFPRWYFSGEVGLVFGGVSD